MSSFSRRQWLKTAGLTSTFSLLGGLKGLATEIEPAPLPPLEEEIIKLSSNENPYGPSPRVRQAIIDSFDKACRYPFAYTEELIKLIAKKHGVGEEHVVLTGGSTEGLKITGLTYGLHRGEIITGEPTFKALSSYAEQFGAYIHRVPLDKNLGYDLDAIAKRITQNTRLIFICNPNNPTGTILPASQFRSFVEAHSKETMIFSDEAYFDYITAPNYPSMVELVKEDQNVIVARTFSKVYGLAGVRIGYLVARPDIAARIRKNTAAGVSVLAIYAAIEAMKEEEFYQSSLAKNEAAKKHIYQVLDGLKLPYIPSHTNFVFFKTGRDISEVQEAMLDQGVRVGRPFPPLTDWCRISTGKMEEVQAFGEGLKKVFS